MVADIQGSIAGQASARGGGDAAHGAGPGHAGAYGSTAQGCARNGNLLTVQVQSDIAARKEASQRLRERIQADQEQLQREAIIAAHAARALLEQTMQERKEQLERTMHERQQAAAREEVGRWCVGAGAHPSETSARGGACTGARAC